MCTVFYHPVTSLDSVDERSASKVTQHGEPLSQSNLLKMVIKIIVSLTKVNVIALCAYCLLTLFTLKLNTMLKSYLICAIIM